MKSKKLIISVVISVAIVLILSIFILGYFGAEKNKSNEKTFVLKSYRNSVALYCNSELIEVYDSVVLNSLPAKDVLDLNRGIILKTMDEVYSLLEDFDG